VQRDREGELDPGKKDGIEVHGLLLGPLSMRSRFRFLEPLLPAASRRPTCRFAGQLADNKCASCNNSKSNPVRQSSFAGLA
jgi:hypothetical protein